MTLKGLTFEGSNLEISHTTKGKRSTGLVQSVSYDQMQHGVGWQYVDTNYKGSRHFNHVLEPSATSNEPHIEDYELPSVQSNTDQL